MVWLSSGETPGGNVLMSRSRRLSYRFVAKRFAAFMDTHGAQTELEMKSEAN
jgi:hypothetical protein